MNTAMRKKWAERCYIDLQAGPGKNRIAGEVVLGSPLIALTAPFPSTRFFLNELNLSSCQALKTRIGASPLQAQTLIYQADMNLIVDQICAQISPLSLNLAFLDPEGLELEWSTVERLARVSRMDLIINFSTSGLKRNIGAKNYEIVDRFFGTKEWRSLIENNPKTVRTVLIDFYRQRLEKFGYYIEIDPEFRKGEMQIRNSKNVEVYSLIFASKHQLGDKFWKQSVKSAQPPKLPGFE